MSTIPCKQYMEIVVNALQQSGRSTYFELVELTGLTASKTREALYRLTRLGRVHKERVYRNKFYYYLNNDWVENE